VPCSHFWDASEEPLGYLAWHAEIHTLLHRLLWSVDRVSSTDKLLTLFEENFVEEDE
jgi:hypothetical protein